MSPETHSINSGQAKICQNCKQEFIIEPEDFVFYDKIKVPPPTFCPECRMKHRMMFRGGWQLYKRKVVGTEKEVYSRYSPDSPYIIYEKSYYESDAWNPLSYGKEYDFSRPFFEQLLELFRVVPKPHQGTLATINSDYCDDAGEIKNCYLVFNAGMSEDVSYAYDISKVKNSLDLLRVLNAELGYELFLCDHIFKTFFSQECNNCSDVWFSKNLTNCQNCFGCVNLQHKQHCIFNRQYSKEEYFKIFESFEVGSYVFVEEMKKKLVQTAQKFPVKYMHGYGNINVSGDYIFNSKNVRNSFNVECLENGAYNHSVIYGKHADLMDVLVGGGQLCYELIVGGGTGVKFSWNIFPKSLKDISTNAYDIEYSIYASSGHDLFGCVGLSKENYCILNKRYSKKEYLQLVPKIKRHMDEMPYMDEKEMVYVYGSQFPLEFSPFAYNETIAQEYFPLTKKEVIEKGYRWIDGVHPEYKVTIQAEDLPDSIDEVTDEFLKETISCLHKEQGRCIGAFRLLPSELKFYKEMQLPLPRLCPKCRHVERIKMRNPLKLWHRTCQCAGAKSANDVYTNTALHSHGVTPCPAEFETSYAPDRPEIVYCEQCYQAEVV